MLGNPPADALPHAELQSIDNFGMRVFRRTQDKLISLEDVDKTRIGLHHRGNNFYGAS